ncbi:RNA-binding protein [Olivibacter sp. SDN3]|uniref:CvfB family protein n=1 Tax=Olivibacter sp. SDN3 TaxID=2764720 RepID=UPI001650E3BD|nr:S1-like domain-containing RNA-binding protein [Olivibacter sp. SDN3]QNL48556.1 RNA-binding protein [Olivibacter sp. SDN3]
MIVIGNFNKLKVVNTTGSGYILSDGYTDIDLPFANTNATELEKEQELEVFVYKNKGGESTATLKKPYGIVGEFAFLKVIAETPNGAFLDLGIEKDLFVPKKEQRWPMVKGRRYIVHVYVDHVTDRMIGSAKVFKFVEKDTIDIQEGDEVNILISEETDLGFNAIINNKYIGLLYYNEIFEDLQPGNKRTAWVKKILPENKIDLSLQPQGYKHVLETKSVILEAIRKNGGQIPLGDKSTPEDIYKHFKISKKVFKKTIGALYKERKVVVEDHKIKIVHGGNE